MHATIKNGAIKMKRKSHIIYVLVVGLLLLLIGLTLFLAFEIDILLIPINFALIIVFIAAIYETSKLRE
jgi:hypothetical protein